MGEDVKLKLDAETAAYVGKMKDADAIARSIGERFKEAGEHIQHRFTHGLERSLFKVLAIKEAVAGIAEGFQKASERAAELSKKAGQTATGSASALSELGFRGEALEGQMTALERQDGASTTQQRVAFAAKLAAENRKRREKFLPSIDQKQSARALSLYASGGDYAFGAGGEDLTKAFDGSHGLQPDINTIAGKTLKQKFGTSNLNAVLDEAPDLVRGEFEIGNVERQQELEASEATRDKGRRARIAAAKIAGRSATHPIAAGVINALNPLTFGAANATLGQLVEGEAGGPRKPGITDNPTFQALTGTSLDKLLKTLERLNRGSLPMRSAQDEH